MAIDPNSVEKIKDKIDTVTQVALSSVFSDPEDLSSAVFNFKESL